MIDNEQDVDEPETGERGKLFVVFNELHKQGMIIGAVGKLILADVQDVGTRFDDVTNSVIPKDALGIYVWECTFEYNRFDERDPIYEGSWRPATAKDLIEVGLIKE